MAKTTKTKTSSRTKKTVNAGPMRRRASQTVQEVIERTQTPIDMVKEMATKSLRFGLGLGAYLLDSPKPIKLGSLQGNLRENLNSFVTTAINKGQKIERKQLERLSSFEQEQRKRIKEFLAARKRDLQRTEASLEVKIEEVITSLDIPTRQDIHQLNRRMNELSKELARQRTTPTKGAKRTKRAETMATGTQNA